MAANVGSCDVSLHKLISLLFSAITRELYSPENAEILLTHSLDTMVRKNCDQIEFSLGLLLYPYTYSIAW